MRCGVSIGQDRAQDRGETEHTVEMKSPSTAPVLIRFKKLHLDQTDTVDYKAVKHKGKYI